MLETNIKKVATQVPAPVTPTTPQSPISGGTYTVGGNHTVDNSAYASGTDANAIALQTYDKQLAAYKAALQAGYEAQANSIAAQAAKLKDQYNMSRNDVYTNSRLSAIGNNERLAARGLAGNLYDYARSGTSETSRIAQDVAMRKALAQQNNAEISANNDLNLKLLEAQKEADAKYAEYAARNEESKLPYLMALADAADVGSGGGGSGGGYYRSAKKSSKKSGRKSGSGSSGGDWDVLSIYNAAADASGRNYSDAYKLLQSSKNDFRSAGASDRTINNAAALLHDQASGAKRTEQLRSQVIKSSGSKSSSKSSSKRMSGQQR
jgi:hypothetical protein